MTNVTPKVKSVGVRVGTNVGYMGGSQVGHGDVDELNHVVVVKSDVVVVAVLELTTDMIYRGTKFKRNIANQLTEG